PDPQRHVARACGRAEWLSGIGRLQARPHRGGIMQRNLRIVSENAADSAAITVPNTASGLGAEWLKTEIKSEVCRILSNEGAITLQWDDPVTVDCVALPAWNGSASSEIRV